MEPTQNVETVPAIPIPVEPTIDQPRGSTGITLRQYIILVGFGAFITTFAQQQVLGALPLKHLLRTDFHLSKQNISFFIFWATFAWNIKPIAGIFTDAFPLFNTRRRHYMIIGTGFAGLLWVVLGFCDSNYSWLLIISVLMNVSTVFASTVMGGLMVEAGQAFNSPGRIASLRQGAQSIASICGPPLGGFLAERTFGWKATTGIAGGAAISLAFITYKFLREKPIRKEDVVHDPTLKRHDYRLPIGIIFPLIIIGAGGTWLLFAGPDFRQVGISIFAVLATFLSIIGIVFMPSTNPVIIKAQGQLVEILRSRTLFMAVIMLFLVYTVPGMNTPLYVQQTEVLKISLGRVGWFGSLEGIFGVIGAAGYAFYCKKINLRNLLLGAIGLNAALTFLYLIYNAGSAPYIHSIGGFVGVLSELALMDLAVRSTPRGCEALGFALMMSVRNFGIGASDIIGSKMMEDLHVSFNQLVTINACTTFAVLLFIPFLPKLVMMRKEGER